MPDDEEVNKSKCYNCGGSGWVPVEEGHPEQIVCRICDGTGYW